MIWLNKTDTQAWLDGSHLTDTTAMKSEIIERLGKTEILLPALIGEGLRAERPREDTALRAAGRRPPRPRARDRHFRFEDECRAAGIDADAMQALVTGASRLAGDEIAAPGLHDLGGAIWDDVGIWSALSRSAMKRGRSGARLSAIKPGFAAGARDRRTRRNPPAHRNFGGKGDSLHRLVMDLHKALNRLSASHAEEGWPARMCMACWKRTAPRSRLSCAGWNRPAS